MKKLLLPLLLALAGTAQAQSVDYEKLVPMELSTVLPKAPYYKAPDTLKANFHVQTKGDKVQVVGRMAPNLAVVNRQGFLYYMPARYLDGFSLVPGTPAWVDAVDKLPTDEKGHITYSGVVPVEGITKNELYTRGKVWFARAFHSAQDVVQADDKEAGVLVGKGILVVETMYQSFYAYQQWEPRVRFLVKLSFKDNRYRYEFTDFSYITPITVDRLTPVDLPAETALAGEVKKNGKRDKDIMNTKNQLNHEAKRMIRELREAMNKPAAGTDW